MLNSSVNLIPNNYDFSGLNLSERASPQASEARGLNQQNRGNFSYSYPVGKLNELYIQFPGFSGLPGKLSLYNYSDTSPRDVNILEVLERLTFLYIKSPETKNNFGQKKLTFFSDIFLAVNNLNKKEV